MSTHATPHRAGPTNATTAAGAGADTAWTTTFALFAAVLMMLAGACGVLAGIAAILHDEVVVGTPQYTYALDLTAWGWIHLVLAVVLGAAGAGVLWGATWARAVGIAAAAINIVAHFAFLPHFPVWALVIIALDAIVIWALASYRGENA
ncbi:hypothetical protein LWC33_34545 [Pseudonocardia sp. RS11V-5]|uniref:DUF7144 family membrane protein n=1 Tax=Pseudonocardia terrae TaxID=2905831 RepID=UPI001E352DD7|nr:hypothetical protein [Pseudonocardia terrae]MCE3556546.1 hypothetical protein [Pseudonocardia terrae]